MIRPVVMLLVSMSALAALSCGHRGESPSPPVESPVVHGKYIVEQVSKCADCHTPMTADGPDMNKWLMGSQLAFAPKVPMPFADYAPKIAGLPNGWSETDMVTFLETGNRPVEGPCRPPMPEFRLNKTDAEAVAAYLKSLGS